MNRLDATIWKADAGGFTAVASTDDVDRDGERFAPYALSWREKTVPIHADHAMSVDRLVARGAPRYEADGRRLVIDARFASSALAQEVRRLVADGVLTSLSVAFLNPKRARGKDGVTVIESGELLAADLVSIPSNVGAQVVSVRSPLAALQRVDAGAEVTPVTATVSRRREVFDARGFSYDLLGRR